MGEKSALYLLSLVLLSGFVQCSGTVLYWTAYLEVIYFDKLNNHTEDSMCECGIYGLSSPLEPTSGLLVLPTSDPLGCSNDPVYDANESLPWIALVKRGNCSFSNKINAAKRQGAAGVVIYNYDGTANDTGIFAHYEAKDIVSIMIGNILGLELVNLVKSGVPVTMVIELGNPQGSWMDTYWLYFLSTAFFVVTAASISYFAFVSVHRLHSRRMCMRAERQLKSEALKAIRRLEVRKLKQGDEETASDVHTCAVCIDSYKPGEVVTVLTCGHFFHKACIEPWLLEKRTCPMCKSDILKALGVEVQGEEEEEAMSPTPSSTPPEVMVVTVSGVEHLYEVPLTDLATPDPEKHLAQDHQHHQYDNRAFEGDSHAQGNMAAKE